MRFLRMLTNSVLAGALGAAYLTVLVLQLNPQMPLVSLSTWRWFLTLGLLYGVHLAVLFYVLTVAREFFTLDVLSPGWVSVRLLAWMAAAAAASAAALMWVNLRGFSTALDAIATRRMTAGAIATSVSAIVLLGLAVAHYSFGRRGSRVGASLFALAAFGSLALPLAARGSAAPGLPLLAAWQPVAEADPAPGPRVVLILLDGASLEYIWPRVADGRLPNFGRLLEAGALMDLATIRPTQPGPVWTAVATGIYPSRNGVRSAGTYYARHDTHPIDLLPDRCLSHALVRLGFVHDEPKSSAALRARPLWSILSAFNIDVGVVRWPLTYPAEPANGFILSDRVDQLVGSILAFEQAVYPAHVVPVAQAVFSEGREADSTAPESSALVRDRQYSRAMRELRASKDPRFVALRYEGLDTVGHHYFRYAQAQPLRAVPEDERRRYSQVVDRYYAFIDGEIGTALESLAAGDLLLVVSGFGMQPLNPAQQLLGRLLGDPDLSGTHENAPDGFLLALGDAVEHGRPQRGSIVDITPTLLYFLGLPVGRDMDGYARADLFTRAFTAERPIAFIRSYNH